MRMQTPSPSVAQSRDNMQGCTWHARQCDTGCPVPLRQCDPDCRYDDGCTGVTNIDFSKGVIKEMMLKNLRQRPLMKWQVMDMTQTKACPSASPCQRGFRQPQQAERTGCLARRIAIKYGGQGKLGLVVSRAQGGILWDSCDL